MTWQRNRRTKGGGARMGGGGGSQVHLATWRDSWSVPAIGDVNCSCFFSSGLMRSCNICTFIEWTEPSRVFHHFRSHFPLVFVEVSSWFSILPPPLLCSFHIFIPAELVQKWNWVSTYPDRVLIFLPVWFLILRKLIFALVTYKTRVKSNVRKIIQDANTSINYSRSNNRVPLHLGIMYPAFLFF